MGRYLRVLGVLVCALVVLSLGPQAFGQSSNGTIAGLIVDKSGAAIPDVNVEVVSSERGGEPRTTTTDSSGSFRVEALLPGKYVVAIKKGGFAELKVSDVEVKASLTSTVNGTLEVAGQAATILVEASA